MFLLLHTFPYVLWLHSFLKMKLTAFVSLPDTSNHKKSGILHICVNVNEKVSHMLTKF